MLKNGGKKEQKKEKERTKERKKEIKKEKQRERMVAFTGTKIQRFCIPDFSEVK